VSHCNTAQETVEAKEEDDSWKAEIGGKTEYTTIAHFLGRLANIAIFQVQNQLASLSK